MGETITLVTNYDDWCALYVNDEMVFEGHSVPDHEWARAVNSTAGPVRAKIAEVKQQWLEACGLPASYGDIPAEALV